MSWRLEGALISIEQLTSFNLFFPYYGSTVLFTFYFENVLVFCICMGCILVSHWHMKMNVFLYLCIFFFLPWDQVSKHLFQGKKISHFKQMFYTGTKNRMHKIFNIFPHFEHKSIEIQKKTPAYVMLSNDVFRILNKAITKKRHASLLLMTRWPSTFRNLITLL